MVNKAGLPEFVGRLQQHRLTAEKSAQEESRILNSGEDNGPGELQTSEWNQVPSNEDSIPQDSKPLEVLDRSDDVILEHDAGSVNDAVEDIDDEMESEAEEREDATVEEEQTGAETVANTFSSHAPGSYSRPKLQYWREKVACRKCDSVTARKNVLHHISAMHVRMLSFACRHCTTYRYPSWFPAQVRKHVKKVHRIANPLLKQDFFNVRSEACMRKMQAEMKECFPDIAFKG